MDMSLDEIIKKKKFTPKVNGPRKRFTPQRKPKFVKKPAIERHVDARNKIIQKNRFKFRDARDKLAQITKANGDVRLKLMKKRKDNRFPNGTQSNNTFRPLKQRTVINVVKQPPKLRPPQFSRLPDMMGAPRGYIDYDNMDRMEDDYRPSSINLRRTVHNNISSPFPSFPLRRERGLSPPMWNNDLFNVYEMPPIHKNDHPDKMHHLPRPYRQLSPDLPPSKGILRSHLPYQREEHRRLDNSHLSYEMRSRLERAPDPHASMGIFANLLKQSSSAFPSSYRIVVSNLHGSVTQHDIKELFEDIGELNESRLVRPGVAEVIFRNLKDAEKAVDTYHNRQLDGQPMKCLLVHPRSSNKPTAPAITTNNSSRTKNKTPLEIDIDALHKVLFRRQ